MSRNPYNRKAKNRKLKNRFYILCEGAKTEPYYLNSFLEDMGYSNGKRVEVKVQETKHNSAKELVKEAKKYKREFTSDEVWVVFDKDGYTKHPEAFSLAKPSNVNIAFSSICFETWILMHFEYTTASFANFDELNRKKLRKYLPDYEKGNTSLYNDLKEFIGTALKNAIKLNKSTSEGNPVGTPLYSLNPYTDIPSLFEALKEFWDNN